MKVKGCDLAHEWTVYIDTTLVNPQQQQQQQGRTYELARFRNIYGFWCIFNNLAEIVAQLPPHTNLRLFKTYTQAFWPELPGGAWLVPIDSDNAIHSFVEIAMMVVGEICDHSETIYGVNVAFDGRHRANAIRIWSSGHATGTDLTWRVRSVLELDDVVAIRFENVAVVAAAAPVVAVDDDVDERFRLIEESFESSEPDLTSCPVSLTYDRQFMRRLALSERCQDLPAYVSEFDWASLTSPSPSPPFVERWAPEDRFADEVAETRVAQSDLDIVRVAEACLDVDSRTPSPTLEVAEVADDLLAIEGCPFCSNQEVVGRPTVLVRCPERPDHDHIRHAGCHGDLLPHCIDRFAIRQWEQDPLLNPVPQGKMSICTVEFNIGHVVGRSTFGSWSSRSVSHMDDASGLETVVFNPSSTWTISRGRMIVNVILVATRHHWRHEIEFDLTDHLHDDDDNDENKKGGGGGVVVDRFIVVVVECQQLHGTVNQLSCRIERDRHGVYTAAAIRYEFMRPIVRPASMPSGGVPASSTSSSVDHVPLPLLTTATEPIPQQQQPLQWSAIASSSSSTTTTTTTTTTTSDVGKALFRRARLQVESRILQDEMGQCTPAELMTIVTTLGPRLPDLMTDPFGHYTAEKLVERATGAQRRRLFHDGLNDDRIVDVACHKLGSFSLQAIMPMLSSSADQLGVAFARHIAPLMTSASGHYVLLKYLDLYGGDVGRRRPLIEAAEADATRFATDHYGLRVMKVIVGHEAHTPGDDQRVMTALSRRTLDLVEDQYGNYIIQLVLAEAANARDDIVDRIYEQMKGRFARMSKQKFSSNVVEQCIRLGAGARRDAVIAELIGAVPLLIRDRFGNYVLQTALECSERKQATILGNAIHRHLYLLRDNVRAKWATILHERFNRMRTKHS